MSRYNFFGATYSDVIEMYPATVLADFDGGGVNGQTIIEDALERATMEVASALTAESFTAITMVESEKVVPYATQGQASFTLGIKPIVAGTVHLWVYPLETPDGYSYEGSGYDYSQKPTKGFYEVATSDYSVVSNTGVVTYAGPTIALGSVVYASYNVDHDSASFSSPMLKQIAILGAAAEQGAKLFTQLTQEWALVTAYRDRYNELLSQLRAGTLVPDEIRRLCYWSEIERAGSMVVGSVRMLRG